MMDGVSVFASVKKNGVINKKQFNFSYTITHMIHCKRLQKLLECTNFQLIFIIVARYVFLLELTINTFGGYLILHFFHCFSASNSPLNLGILTALISFHSIFSALSKYVLPFNISFFNILEMRGFVQFSTFSFYSL